MPAKYVLQLVLRWPEAMPVLRTALFVPGVPIADIDDVIWSPKKWQLAWCIWQSTG